MSNFKLGDYQPVQERIMLFYEKYPEGRIFPEIVFHTENFSMIIFKVTIYSCKEDFISGIPFTYGFAEETKDSSFVNKVCHVENCETSAIGRALANIGLHGNKRPSREEMEKIQRSEEKKEVVKKPEEKNEVKIPHDDIKSEIKKAKELIAIRKKEREEFKLEEKPVETENISLQKEKKEVESEEIPF